MAVVDLEDLGVGHVGEEVESVGVVVHLRSACSAHTHLPAHLADDKVRGAEADVQRGSKGKWAEGAVWCNANVECPAVRWLVFYSLGHVGNLLGLRDATSVCNVRLDNVDAPSFKVWAYVLAGEETLTELVLDGVQSHSPQSEWSSCYTSPSSRSRSRGGAAPR